MNRCLLISPALLRAVSYTAAVGWLLSMAIPLLCLLEPALWFAGFQGQSIMVGFASDNMCLVHLALLGILCPWCHEVLVAARGSDFTRFISPVIGFFGLLLLLDTIYGSLTGVSILTVPDIIVFCLGVSLFVTVLLNITNIAAAPLWMRISLPLAFLFHIGCALTMGILPLLLPYTVLKLITGALLVKPFALLWHNAQRIASLPEKEETR